jgi:uncharacterized protein YecT (DUF1311 family)
MRHLALIVAGLSLCMAAPAISAQRPAKAIKLPTQCSGFSNSQQAATCYNNQLDAAAKSLEATIAEIKTKGKFDPDASLSKTFDSAHDFWLKEMNLTCHALGEFYEGGTLAAIEPLRCKVEMTEGREVLLRSLYRTVLKN